MEHKEVNPKIKINSIYIKKELASSLTHTQTSKQKTLKTA